MAYRLLYVLPLLLFGCAGGGGYGDSIVVNVDLVDEDFPVERLMTEVEAYPLAENDDFLLGYVNKFIKRDSLFYILSNEKREMFVYDERGNPVRRMHRVGRGPNEYARILDFDFDSNGDLFLLCDPGKLFIMTPEFEVKNVLETDGRSRYMVCHEGTVLMHDFYSNKVFSFDPATGTTETIWQGKVLGIIENTRSPFFKGSDGDLYFHTSHTFDIFRINGMQFERYISLDFEKRRATEKFYASHSMSQISFEEIAEYMIPSVLCINETEEYFTFIYSNFFFSAVQYDKKTGTYTHGMVPNFPGIGGYVYWSDNVLYGCESSFDIDFYSDYYYTEELDIKFAYPPRADNDNPVITQGFIR